MVDEKLRGRRESRLLAKTRPEMLAEVNDRISIGSESGA
jgi:hypothetical protein